ncbi:peptide ABC transporter substrate-binding protein [Candidatus Woesearchaeota archaeon]|nr:peptide ABC transporter substrate-binding protein [Candidatus Woesearchaeota archaeon]|tara:strand:- start:2398 stop:3375 length:978 start_codon:yes stop_codon:yes gene_type:complete
MKNKLKPLLTVKDLYMHFPIRRGLFQKTVAHAHAADGVSFDIASGETLGLVGESGCGKTTVGRIIVRLQEPTTGKVLLEGKNVFDFNKKKLKTFKRNVQIIFQDPYSSLNPRMTAGAIVSEPMIIHNTVPRNEINNEVKKLFDRVGLHSEQIDRYPHEFSGGQRQRLSIARALSLNPKLIVADEPVSALDVSIQAQVVNLLTDLQRDFQLSYIFISHDINVVGYISTRIAVMYLGQIMELAPRRKILTTPLHPYTESLLNSVPIPNPNIGYKRIKRLKGEVPSSINPPSGCPFHTRCPIAEKKCSIEKPILREIQNNHFVACHLR